ncbi:methyltransferase [Nonomuraea rubra]|uniref:Methyltransferase n=1 Tax=Nonomuraea rubra TaxID=46180 RepID=A0A7X0NXB4_9ACTN|nr:methyltransferase [Nonomuraea rubra]MBB6551134.1 hypothetical protein [Nonomuraea rubra]
MRPELIARAAGLVTGAWVAQAVSTAAALSVPDELARGPRPVTELAVAVGADAGALYRLLRALSGVGVVEEGEDRVFALTELGELLTAGALGGFAVMLGAPFHRRAWTDLEHSVRTGESAFARLYGGFEHFGDHPGDGEVLNAGMTAASNLLLAPAVLAYDFTPFGAIVDVGGGHGALLALALSGHPSGRGVLFDLPHVIATAGRPLREAGVAGRCELVAGDFFQRVPAGDAYLLANIVHDWDDERAVAILSGCRAAMTDGGHVLLVEAVLPATRNEPHPATLIDLEMLVMNRGGRQRTLGEHQRLLERAGLRLTREIRSEGTFSLLDAAAA